MDFLVKHWAPFPRRFLSPFPLGTFDYIARKKGWVRWAFNSCNFSLILQGRGEFHRAGKLWEVRAPCVITQWPGEFLEYGPLPGETWSELYLIYPARLMKRFQQCNLIDPALPVWSIADPEGLAGPLEELQRLSRSLAPEHVADRIDRVCERLILESRLPSHSAPTKEAPPIEALVSEIRGKLADPVDFQEAAARNGMSQATFRRRWADFSPIPPARFLQQLRIREACRLLAETRRPIYEIAHAVGFEDELYFSRRFHKEMNLSPRAYRQAHQITHHH